MRRISLAVALVGAMAAAAGCGGGAKPAAQSGAKGTAGVNFDVKVNNQGPGTVTATPSSGAVLTCGPSTTCDWTFATGVTVTLTGAASDGNYFNGFFGQCTGTAACVLSGDASKYVVAYFSATPQAHPNFNNPADHVSAWAAGVLRCDQCHGTTLQGQGLAPACNACHPAAKGGHHDWPIAPAAVVNQPLNGGVGHFAAAGHNSGTCARCHSSAGFKDWIGADGTGSNIADVKYAGGDYTSASGPVCKKTAVPPVNENCWNDPASADPLGTTAQWYYASGYRCDACHNSVTALGGGSLNTHKFPAGAVLTMDGNTAICAQCHDGGRPDYEVAKVVSVIGATADDVQIAAGSNKVVRAHYLPAASTLFGAEAANWYQYPTKVYTARNLHGGKAACTDCHDAHSGKLPYDDQFASKCGACHFNEAGAPVQNFLELEEARQFGFEGDIDGDGNALEPLKDEINGLGGLVYSAMRVYAKNVAGADICAYNNRYYLDSGIAGGTAGNGICETGETQKCSTSSSAADATACTAAGGVWTAQVEYNKFTPRLLRAGYNYLMFQQDVGAWAHNPRYAIEVLYDTLFDLNAGIRADATAPIGVAVDTAAVRGSFTGHFGSSGFAVEPYAQFLYHPAAGSFFGTRGTGFTGNTCYQCHGGKGGLAAYLTGAPVAKPATSDCIGAAPCAVATGGQPTSATPGTLLTYSNRATGLQCATCHVDAANMKGLRSDVTTLFVPPQKGAVGSNGVVSFAAANLPAGFIVCATCHTGLENMASVDAKIAAAPEPQAIGFVNGHYYGAAGIILGSDAKVLYEYPTKTYQGKAVNFAVGTANGPHGSPHGARCTGCHDPQGSKHSFEIDENVTVVKGTFYGAPNTKTCNGCHVLVDATHDYRLAPAKANLQTLGADLLKAIQDYAWARKDAVKLDGTTLANEFYFATGTGAGVCYNGAVYPYFIRHGTASGDCTAQEITNATPYAVRTQGAYVFDAKLLKAAYNYQWFVKDPGAAEHNYLYIGQVLFDAIADLGGTTTVARP